MLLCGEYVNELPAIPLLPVEQIVGPLLLVALHNILSVIIRSVARQKKRLSRIILGLRVRKPNHPDR
jgi:hypothetical protein